MISMNLGWIGLPDSRRCLVDGSAQTGRAHTSLGSIPKYSIERGGYFRHQLLLGRKTQTPKREFDRLNWTEDYKKNIL
jgi:hypothetical protein